MIWWSLLALPHYLIGLAKGPIAGRYDTYWYVQYLTGVRYTGFLHFASKEDLVLSPLVNNFVPFFNVIKRLTRDSCFWFTRCTERRINQSIGKCVSPRVF